MEKIYRKIGNKESIKKILAKSFFYKKFGGHLETRKPSERFLRIPQDSNKLMYFY